MRTAQVLGIAGCCWMSLVACGGAGGGSAGGTPNATPGSSGQTGVAAGAGVGVGPGAGGNGSVVGAGGIGAVADPNAAGLLPLRRLTAREYLNTVRDLLADTTLETGDVPNEADDTSNNAFPFRQPGSIGTADAKSLQAAGEQLAQNLSSKLTGLIPCTPSGAADEVSCATQFISKFGQKMYRRPLSTEESADLLALYQSGRTMLALDFKGAIDLLLEAMLQAPGFLYHWELDPTPSVVTAGVVQLGNYQVANRLSYFLWGSMPDDALFAAAASGELATTAGLEKQARRMLLDAKAKDAVADFFDDWLDTNTLSTRPKDPALYPQWNQTLATSMENEVRAFGVASVLNTGRFADLLTGTASAVDQPLAAIYGLKGISGSTPQAATFDAAQRSGVFTLAGFLTATGAADGSSPVRRGHKIYTRLMCQTLPDPPTDVPPAAAPTPGKTTRQRFVEHDENGCTGICHKAMDPIGFGFENYDGVGQFRTMDQNLPVDAHGTIDLDGKTQTFTDGVALSKLLGGSAQIQNCFTTQWLRYALNRWDSAEDTASVRGAAASFAAANLDMRELIVGLTTSRTFRFRKPAIGETVK